MHLTDILQKIFFIFTLNNITRRNKMEKKDFDVMEACAASALDFIDTVMFCMKDDGFEDDVINDYKEYLLDAYKVHYDTDIGEQGENITKYLDECNSYDKKAFEEKLTLLQKGEGSDESR